MQRGLLGITGRQMEVNISIKIAKVMRLRFAINMWQRLLNQQYIICDNLVLHLPSSFNLKGHLLIAQADQSFFRFMLRPFEIISYQQQKMSDCKIQEMPRHKADHYDAPTKGCNQKAKNIKPVSKKEIDDIIDKVKIEIAVNRRRYEKLLLLNPYFTIKLYRPKNTISPDSLNTETITALLGQIDLLLEEGNLLEKEIKKSELRRMQNDYLEPGQRDEIKHHYTYLRKVWLDLSKMQSQRSADRIEELNKRVIMIKNSTNLLVQHERSCYEYHKEDKYQRVANKVAEVVATTAAFASLLQKYEHSQMILCDNQHRLQRICSEYQQQIDQQATLIQKLTSQNKQLKKGNILLKQKILCNERKQSELQLVVNQLKIKLQNCSKQSHHFNSIPKVKQNSLGNDIQFAKQNLFIETIKFRKIEPTNTKQKDITQKQIQNRNSGQKSINLLQIEISMHKPNTITSRQINKQIAERHCMLRDNMSADGKRGRFTRMKSPGCTKLIKKQQYFLNHPILVQAGEAHQK